jgi:putative selenate reductase
MARELEGDSLYGIAQKDWWVPDPQRNLEMSHLGKPIASPVGPASGPHTQLAQNLLLSWLVGGRFMELKTVQVNDELEIPRPCIFVPHVGYNVEWSQELRVPQSAAEYVKGWMLLHMLCSEHGPGLWEAPQTIFDISLGYDLEGIRSDKVRAYLDTMRDGEALIAALREELPASLARWREVEVPSQISDTITLSTFHGCPAHEIEAIAEQTLDWGFHTIVKLNPTLLGHDRCRAMLDTMGYDFIRLSPEDFERDLQWSQLLEMVPRLEARAQAAGLGFGVKFTNTLVSHSPEPPFGEGEMYLSGPPLHVLSFTLAAEFQETTGGRIPATFSAGVDAQNFSACIAAGLGPVTTCSDLLKGRGYARMTRYLRNLEKEMATLEVDDLAAYRLAAGPGRNTAEVLADVRYHRAQNQKAPRKVGSQLEIMDCLTCDKCIPVCPNFANFSIPVETGEFTPGHIRWQEGEFSLSTGEPLLVAKRHQIGTVADSCNLCGECDPWCPEDGGPHLAKANLFLDPQAFSDHPERDGFHVSLDRQSLRWRYQGEVYGFHRDDSQDHFATPTGEVVLRGDQPLSTSGRGDCDLRIAVTMRLFLEAFANPDHVTWLPPVEATD